MRNKNWNTASYFVPVFLFSGAAGLAYQVVWAKAFAAAIGHEFPAVLAVITAFMSGMALGNILFARRAKLDARWYGWLELIIAAWGAATILIIPRLEQWLTHVLGPTPSPFFYWNVVFFAVLVCLLPATAAMGATLPAAERFLSARIHSHTTGLLYGANTMGAALGGVAAAFWLMPNLGIRNSLLVFSAANVVCGILALQLVRRNHSHTADATPAPARTAHENVSLLAIRLFLSGLLGIGFEIVIIRALSHVLENTVYTFAVVVATYLVGTAIGALLFYRFQQRLLGKTRWLFPLLSLVCLVEAIALRWSAPFYHSIRASMGDSQIAVAAAETLTGAAYFLIPSICMGLTWCWLTQTSLTLRPSLAWSVAINTIGSAVAPILVGLILIPVFSLKGALLAIPLGYAALGGRTRLALAAVLLIFCGFPFITSTRDLIETMGSRIISLREGVMGSVAVLEDQNGSRILKFNNRFQMGGTAARIAEERQADIPLLLHPKPKRSLFIGLGTGITFSASKNFPNLEADAVELAPEIAAAMPFFVDTTSASDANQRIHIADGRRFIRATRDHYDVIVSDLFHPAQDGTGFLYTIEHFAAIRERLAPNGLFCQWLPLYQMDLHTVRIISATFAMVFPRSELWLLRFNIDTPVIGLIGRTGPSAFAPVDTKSVTNNRLADHLRSVGLNDSVRLLGCYVGQIARNEDVPVNSDANPVVIFQAPALTFRRDDDPAKRLMDLLAPFENSTAGPPWLFADSQLNSITDRVQAFIRARDIYLRGLQTENAGNLKEAIFSYVDSARISPDFTQGYAQALAIASGLSASDRSQAMAILEALIAVRPERPVARELLQKLNE